MLLCVLPAFAFAADKHDSLLSVSRGGTVVRSLSIESLEALGAVAVTVQDDAGRASEYTGVPISRLLESAGIALGKSISGARFAEYVMVRAKDGYRVLFSLAEIDPAFRERTVLICYRKDGGDLPAMEGPLRVVVADEKRHARWARQVDSIEIGGVEALSATR